MISGGRAILGIGAAWFEAEHRAYGFDFPPLKERFERLDEALRICRAMFTQEAPSFEGSHYRIDGVLNNPRPIRGDIPILVGGSGERKTLRLVAEHADGCNIVGEPDGCAICSASSPSTARPSDATRPRSRRPVTGRSRRAHARGGRAQAGALARAPGDCPRSGSRMMLVHGDPDEVAEQGGPSSTRDSTG